MEGLEGKLFEIIVNVGSAKSYFIEAIAKAKTGDIDGAFELIAEGDKAYIEGHKVHAELIQQEASGEKIEMSMILMHAEDQLMNADGFKIIAKEFIDLYKLVLDK